VVRSPNACRVCRRPFGDDWWKAGPEGRAEVERQISFGICDPCQRKRQSAAREYIVAADDVRLMFQILTALGDRTPEQYRLGMTEALINRVKTAEARCVALRMWSWHRDADTPERFREPLQYPPRERRYSC
jgi:hypothetical protein